MKTIVVAVEISNTTPAMVELATSVAKCHGAKSHLFQAVEPHVGYVTSKVQADLPDITRSMAAGTPPKKLLEQHADRRGLGRGQLTWTEGVWLVDPRKRRRRHRSQVAGSDLGCPSDSRKYFRNLHHLPPKILCCSPT